MEANSRILKVAYIDYILEPDKPGRSGLSDVVWDMASELTNQGHEAHIIASYYTRQYPDPRVIVHNFPTPPIGYRNFIGQLWILKRATDIVKQEHFDIVHAPEYVSTAVLATFGVKTPLVLTVPGNIYQRIAEGYGSVWWYNMVLKWAIKVSIKQCARIIAISHEMKIWWEKIGSDPNRISCISLGVNRIRFQPVNNARQILDLPENKIIFIYVGRFSKEKGIIDLLNAVAEMRRSTSTDHMQFYLIGNGPQRKEIEQFINKQAINKYVFLVNWVNQNELKVWYSAADFLIMPSLFEPAGRVLLEALSCGTPVISSNTGSGRDHIKDGINGFLIKTHEIDSITNILNKIINGDINLQLLRLSTRVYAEKNLAWSQIMSQIIRKVYEPITN
jgi:glycosyltransferase involved in cell wall biosynthesis